jgi:hypothetical protein
MDGVHVPEDEDAGLAGVRMSKRPPQAITTADATGNRLDGSAHRSEIARRESHHAIYRIGVECRALALDPGLEAREHRLEIKR